MILLYKKNGIVSGWELNYYCFEYLMSRVFANGPGDQSSILGQHTKDSKNSTWCCLA